MTSVTSILFDLVQYKKNALKIYESLRAIKSESELWRHSAQPEFVFSDELLPISLPSIHSHGGAYVYDIADFLDKHPDYAAHVLGSGKSPWCNNVYASYAEAQWNRGVVVYVPKDVCPQGTLDLSSLQINHESSCVEKIVVIIESHASLSLTSGSDKSPLDLLVRSVVCYLGTGARLNYFISHEHPVDALVIETSAFHLGRNAELNYWVNYGSGKKIVSYVDLMLEGEASRAVVKGAYRLKASQEVVLQTRQEHKAPHTSSELLIKGMLEDQSKAVYQGTIFVNEQGSGTQASQTNKNILLSDTARAHSMPQLEVLTNDVTCQHGSAVGYLDLEQLHYLQSRGLSEMVAKKLLLHAFFSDVVYQDVGKD